MSHRNFSKTAIIGGIIAKISALSGVLAMGVVFAQPNAPTGAADYLCQPTPAANVSDTIPDAPDAEGFTTIFDGSSFKGWWHNCASGHTGDKVNGAIWKVDPVEKAMYSTQRGQNGGLMLTKKKIQQL